MRRGEILLQRRALGKYHTPGLWANTCCTHPDWSEDPAACARRRLREELGITGLTPEFRHRLEYRADVGNGLTEHERVDVFTVSVEASPEQRPNPAEVMDTCWISYPALTEKVASSPEVFTPWLRIYLRDHANTILGRDLDLSGQAQSRH